LNYHAIIALIAITLQFYEINILFNFSTITDNNKLLELAVWWLR